jgi:hypothetical protein
MLRMCWLIWLRCLLLMIETEFNPREIHLGFQVNKVIMDRFSSEYSGPWLPISIYDVWLEMSRNTSVCYNSFYQLLPFAVVSGFLVFPVCGVWFNLQDLSFIPTYFVAASVHISSGWWNLVKLHLSCVQKQIFWLR